MTEWFTPEEVLTWSMVAVMVLATFATFWPEGDDDDVER